MPDEICGEPSNVFCYNLCCGAQQSLCGGRCHGQFPYILILLPMITFLGLLQLGIDCSYTEDGCSGKWFYFDVTITSISFLWFIGLLVGRNICGIFTLLFTRSLEGFVPIPPRDSVAISIHSDGEEAQLPPPYSSVVEDETHT
jgi:hypothetical protein